MMWLYLSLLLLSIALFIISHLIKNPETKYKWEPLKGVSYYFLSFALGAFLTYGNTYSFKKDFYQKSTGEYFVAEISEGLTEKANSYKSTLEIISFGDSTNVKKVSGRLLVYFAKDDRSAGLAIGDQIVFQNNVQCIKEIENPGQFNYKQYLEFHQIYDQTYLASGNWKKLDIGAKFSILHFFDVARNNMLERIEAQGFKSSEYAIAAALLLGKKDSLDPELIRTYASAGAMHVLAVSGLHVGILFMVLNFLLKFLERNKGSKILKVILLLATIWAYAVITGLSPSVVRASTMFSAIVLGDLARSRSSTFNTIASSAFLLLAIDPYYLMEVGFQLSYLAVLAIVYIQPKIYSLIDVRGWLPDKIWAITSVSIAAQIGTFPLGILYFHQFPTLFIFSNLVVIPGAFLILFAGIMFFLFTGLDFLLNGLLEVVVDFLGTCLWGLIKALNVSVAFVESVPYSLISGIDISVFESWLLYALILSFFGYLAYRRFYWLAAVLFVSNGFCLNQINEKIKINSSASLTIYKVNNTCAINFIKPEENILLTDSLLIEDDQKQLFHIKNNWNKKDAVVPLYMDFSKPDTSHHRILTKGFYLFQNELIVHFHKKNLPKPSQRKLYTDLMIISENPWMEWKQVFEYYNPKFVVLDSSNKNYVVRKWKAELDELGISYWDVNEHGAFVKDWELH
ncbi:MAG: DUF4131 domain-containing protein [Flavobacteriales bacterium]|nr:DUF4131 domain-containing protein [Flavobacteriales bacterium]